MSSRLKCFVTRVFGEFKMESDPMIMLSLISASGATVCLWLNKLGILMFAYFIACVTQTDLRDMFREC